MTDPAMPPDLDRLLSAASVPAMSAGLIDRIVAEAARPDRVALPAPILRRSRGRWARYGARTGIVAGGLMLATAVAATIGGGPILTKIAAVAQHVVHHIAHPFHHEALVAPVRNPVVHRMTVPPAMISATPRGGMPMVAPHPLVAAPFVARPMAMRQAPMHASPRPMAVAERPHSARVTSPRFSHRPAARPFAHRVAAHFGEPRQPRVAPFRSEPRVPVAAPIVPRIDPVPVAPLSAPAARDGGLARDGGNRLDGPGWRNPDRAPGWRRRMQNGGGMNAPGWRRRPGMGGGGMARPRPFRPGGGGGGRRPRRF